MEVNNISRACVTFLEKSHTELRAEDFGGRRVDGIIGEPYFSSSLLPWHNLHFWYAINSVMSCSVERGKEEEEERRETPVILPGRASLMAIAGECSE